MTLLPSAEHHSAQRLETVHQALKWFLLVFVLQTIKAHLICLNLVLKFIYFGLN